LERRRREQAVNDQSEEEKKGGKTAHLSGNEPGSGKGKGVRLFRGPG